MPSGIVTATDSERRYPNRAILLQVFCAMSYLSTVWRGSPAMSVPPKAKMKQLQGLRAMLKFCLGVSMLDFWTIVAVYPLRVNDCPELSHRRNTPFDICSVACNTCMFCESWRPWISFDRISEIENFLIIFDSFAKSQIVLSGIGKANETSKVWSPNFSGSPSKARHMPVCRSSTSFDVTKPSKLVPPKMKMYSCLFLNRLL